MIDVKRMRLSFKVFYTRIFPILLMIGRYWRQELFGTIGRKKYLMFIHQSAAIIHVVYDFLWKQAKKSKQNIAK